MNLLIYFSCSKSETGSGLDGDVYFPILNILLPDELFAGGITFDGTYFWVSAQSFNVTDRFFF